jgi:IS30 family transposase
MKPTCTEEKNMGQVKNTTESRKGKHLTYIERLRIEVLYKESLKPIAIGTRLNRNRRTIERELAAGMVELEGSFHTRWEYSADLGQKRHDERARNKGPGLKIGKDHELAAYIEEKIGKEKYSPEAVIGELKVEKKEFNTSICVKTLYNYISADLFLNISNKDLWIKRNGRKRKQRKIHRSQRMAKGKSIEERPKEVEKRKEIGHWEMDTVVGGKGGNKDVLLVLSERCSRKELIFKMKDKSQHEVIKVLNRLERRHGGKFKKIFQTITVDNGTEFLDYEGIEKSISSKKKRTKLYFAHSYSSWERGTNENINKMIRRFIPKGADISQYSKAEIQRIETWINNYPRRILGYYSANKIYQSKVA